MSLTLDRPQSSSPSSRSPRTAPRRSLPPFPACVPLGRAAMRGVALAFVALLLAAPATAQLALGIESHRASTATGELVETVITVTNQGVANVSSLEIQLDLPAAIDPFGQELISDGSAALLVSSCNGGVSGATCEGGELLLWSMASITAGESTSMSVSTRVASGAGSSLMFLASLRVASVLTLQASSVVAVDDANDLVLALAEDRDPVAAGTDLAYALHFGNRSTTDTAPDAVLTMPIPVGMSFVSATGGGVAGGGQIEWMLGDLLPGQTGQRGATFAVASSGLPDGSLLLAEATLTDLTLPTSQTAHATAITEVDGDEAFALGLELTPDPVAPGARMLAELTLTNQGVTNRSSLSLHLRLPEGIEPFLELLLGEGSAVTANDSCNGLGLGGATCEGGEFIRWTMASIAAGESTTVQMPVEVSSSLAASELLTFSGYVTDGGSTDARAAVRRTVAVDATQTLALSLEESADPVMPGEALRYAVHYGNRSSTTTAPAAALTMPVPDGTTFVSATHGGILNGDRVEWTLGDLAPGETGQQSATFAVAGSGLPDGHLLRAGATLSDASLPVAGEARAEAIAEVDADEPFAFALELPREPVAPGAAVVADLTLTNRSLANRSSPSLYLRLPEGFDPFDEAVLGEGSTAVGSDSCNGLGLGGATCEGGEFIRWSMASLAAEQSTTVQVPLVVASGVADGTLLSLAGYAVDGGSTDVRASVRGTVAVDAGESLSLALSESVDPVVPGATLDYTLRFANGSTTTSALGATLSMPVPEGMSFVSATGGGVLGAGQVDWALGDLVPGFVDERSATFAVASTGLPDGSLLRAEAAFSDSARAAGEGVRARAVTEVDLDERLDLDLVVTPERPEPGDAIAVELTLTNLALTNVSSVSVYLRVPQGVDVFASSSVGEDELVLAGDACIGVAPAASCEPLEFIRWTLNPLDVGESTSVTVPMFVATGLADGTLIDFSAYATDGGSVDDRASVRKAIPEPGFGLGLIASIALFSVFARRRRATAPASGLDAELAVGRFEAEA